MENSLTESKMETIRKKVDMLRISLNDAERRADESEECLKSAKERNLAVRILIRFCSFTLVEIRLKLFHCPILKRNILYFELQTRFNASSFQVM